MNEKFEASVDEEIKQASMKRPHVVVLGAGASRATCPNGDRSGRILPLMTDFVEVVGLEGLLQGWGIDPSRNFETIFTELYNDQEQNKIETVENTIDAYFENLTLPDEPTVYDHLVLSLRGKDLIATFNWDPLLIQAYLRNGRCGLGLPQLAFLHGNVRVGYCEKNRVVGPFGEQCRHCGEPYKRAPLLYPIEKKDYGTNVFIADAWKQLRFGFENAFMITIFGYSGPRTDEEALSVMRALRSISSKTGGLGAATTRRSKTRLGVKGPLLTWRLAKREI